VTVFIYQSANLTKWRRYRNVAYAVLSADTRRELLEFGTSLGLLAEWMVVTPLVYFHIYGRRMVRKARSAGAVQVELPEFLSRANVKPLFRTGEMFKGVADD